MLKSQTFRNNLPLRLAIEQNAPDQLILSILSVNEDAAAVKGKDGSLPLHQAAAQKLSPNVIIGLIKAYPEALDEKFGPNQLTPRMYDQDNNISLEALSRPTACFIEDVEKENYMKRVRKRRLELRNKVYSLNKEIETSRVRRSEMTGLIKELSHQIDMKNAGIDADEKFRERLSKMKGVVNDHVIEIKQRLTALDTQIFESNDDTGSILSNSSLRREYILGVKDKYTKLLSSQKQIGEDLVSLKESFS